MRTFTVVPSFDGNSAFFELPDIGFQGDNLSFAILFNLTELTEHWPDIVPAMIVTDADNNTFIAPHVSWSAATHIFTWYISEIETAYKGVVRCQLKCTKTDDPDTIVCMSRICQTRVYESLEEISDPPEAFQSWIDTLAQLGASVNAEATAVLESVEISQANASAAQTAANDAVSYKNAAEAARDQAAQSAQTANTAKDQAVQAQQAAASSATAAATAKTAAEAAQAAAESTIEEIDQEIVAAQSAASTATDAASQASESMSAANTAKLAAEAAKDDAVTAKRAAETAENGAQAAQVAAETAKTAAQTAQTAAETAETGAVNAKTDAVNAKTDAVNAKTDAQAAKTASEAARDRAETARVGVEAYAEESKKWATGLDASGNDVLPVDPTYENNARYWAGLAAAESAYISGYGLYVDSEGHGFIRSNV